MPQRRAKQAAFAAFSPKSPLDAASPDCTIRPRAHRVDKGLLCKGKATDDRRAIALTLTHAGQQRAEQVLGGSAFLQTAIAALSPEEQVKLLQSLTQIIKTLQEQGQISVTRMCLTCRYFRPNVYTDAETPHHCDFVDAPFGDRQLQVNCPDHQPYD